MYPFRGYVLSEESNLAPQLLSCRSTVVLPNTPIDPPGSTDSSVSGISDNIVFGNYFDANFRQEVFLYNGTTYTTFGVPGSPDTSVAGVSGNNVFGAYREGYNFYGFLYNGSTYTTIDPLGSKFTFVTGVSGNNVVGGYLDANGIDHGYLFQPDVSAAPEPSGLVLFGTALFTSLGYFAVRRQNPSAALAQL